MGGLASAALGGCSSSSKSSSKGADELNLMMPTSNLPLMALNKKTTLTAADKKKLGPDAEPLLELLQAWKAKHKGVKLNITEVQWTNITQQVILQGQAHKTADLVFVNDLNIPKLAAGGFFTPLDKFSGNYSDYSQGVLKGVASYKNKIYALPFTTDCRLVYYWKEDFQKAGISEPPQTWDDMFTAFEKLKAAGAPGGYGFWAGNSVHTPTQSLLSSVWMQDADVVDSDGKATLKTDAMRNVFKFYKKVLDEGYGQKNLLSVSDDKIYGSTLLTHKVSMLHGGSWFWDGDILLQNLQSKLGYFRTPKPTASAKDATLTGFWGFEIPTGAPKERNSLAFDFAMHFTDANAQKSLGAVDNSLPTRQSVAKDTSFTSAKSPFWQYAAKYALEGRGMPVAADDAFLFDNMRLAFERYLSGQGDLDTVLGEAESKYNNAK